MWPSSSTSPDAPCRQPEPGADRSGPAEVLRILNRGRKRGRGHGADARHRHQDLACLAPAGAGDELPSKLCRAQAHGPPRFKERKQDRGKSLLISQERADMGLKTAALAGRHHEPECLHQPADLVRELGRDLHQPVPRRHQCASEHAVEALDPHLTKEPDLGELRQTIGIVRIRLVGGHVESRLGMARIDADRRQPFRGQRMIEPHRQGPGLEHHPSGPRCAAADHLGDEPRIGRALAAPDPFAVAADRHRRFLHRHVQTYILSHLHPPVSSTQARAIARRPRDTIMIGRAAVGSTPAPTRSERWGDSLPRLPHVDAPDGNNLPEWWCCKSLQEAFMNQVSTVGLDLAKHIFRLHGADSAGAVVFRQKLRRGQLLAFLATLPPCTVAMESCGSAHDWGREIAKLGHTVRLISPAYVKPFVKRQKNDRADAEAICEAAQRPTMRFVALKSVNQQAAAVVFRTRDLLVRQRTQAINALRGHLAEFGVVAAKGPAHTCKLVAAIEDPASDLPQAARAILAVLVEELRSLDERIAVLDREIARHAKENAVARRLTTIPGIGAVTAAALTALAPPAHTFRRGRDFAAWLGLTPVQRSSGGKERLGKTSKIGERALRRLLIIGASAVARWAARKGVPAGSWLGRMLARKSPMLVRVALANKMARIVWALLAKGGVYRAPVAAV